MKKFFALLAMFCATFATQAQAQTSTFAKGDEIVSLGIGLGDSKTYGKPIVLSYEKGVYDINSKSAIGVGGSIAYQHKDHNFIGSDWDKIAYNGCIIAVTGAYHYDVAKNLDLFASLSLGGAFGNFKWKVGGEKDKYGDDYFYYGINVGARYYFSQNWAAYAKLGFTPTSFFEVGASHRFDVSSLFR